MSEVSRGTVNYEAQSNPRHRTTEAKDSPTLRSVWLLGKQRCYQANPHRPQNQLRPKKTNSSRRTNCRDLTPYILSTHERTSGTLTRGGPKGNEEDERTAMKEDHILRPGTSGLEIWGLVEMVVEEVTFEGAVKGGGLDKLWPVCRVDIL